MSRASPVQSILRSAGLPAIALIAMGFFGYYAILGPNGVFALREYKQQVAQRTVQYQALDKQRAALQNRVGLLDPVRGVDPDLADELTRKGLNVNRPDELIVPRTKK
jgi:cell division protein FtsB